MRAHQAAKVAMKAVKPDLQVGITLSLHDIQPQPGGEAEAQREWNEEFLHYLPYIQEDDFFGLQNYTRTLIGAEGSLTPPDGAETTQMGYEFYPKALGNVIRTVHQSLNIPILVTENGIATSDDTRRVAFIQEALAGVEACIADGIPVIGYCHWSLMDNFEWQKGFSMTFGLIAVDRANGQTRHPKPSLAYLGSYATTQKK
jgi:beta-glucosidase